MSRGYLYVDDDAEILKTDTRSIAEGWPDEGVVLEFETHADAHVAYNRLKDKAGPLGGPIPGGEAQEGE